MKNPFARKRRQTMSRTQAQAVHVFMQSQPGEEGTAHAKHTRYSNCPLCRQALDENRVRVV